MFSERVQRENAYMRQLRTNMRNHFVSLCVVSSAIINELEFINVLIAARKLASTVQTSLTICESNAPSISAMLPLSCICDFTFHFDCFTEAESTFL